MDDLHYFCFQAQISLSGEEFLLSGAEFKCCLSLDKKIVHPQLRKVIGDSDLSLKNKGEVQDQPGN